MKEEVLAAINRLTYLLDNVTPLIKEIPATDFTHKPGPEKWSRQEIIGHLIDSAANNHHRFIRIQYEEVPVIYYDQNKWNTLSGYAAYDKDKLVQLWELYNRHLVEIIKRIPDTALTREGESKNKERHALEWYITDYVAHLEHHLKQVVNY